MYVKILKEQDFRPAFSGCGLFYGEYICVVLCGCRIYYDSTFMFGLTAHRSFMN